MMKRILVVTGLLLFAGQVSVVRADEIAELKKQLAEMQRRLELLEAKQKQQEQQMAASQQQQEEQIDAKVDAKVNEAVAKKEVTVPDSLKWAEKIKLSGDFRYRHEYIDAEDGSGDRHRNRIRARLKIAAKLSDELDTIFRVATAETDSDLDDGLASGSTSTNQTLTREFKQKNLWLDWAYADYHPASISGSNFLLGKMGTPFYKVAKHQLLWDNDLAWEGGAANRKITLDDEKELQLHGGGFWLRERDGVETADTSLWTSQVALAHKLDKASLLYGASYYHVGNSDIPGYTNLERGTSADFDDQFNIVELFGELGTKLDNGLPISIYGVYADNVGTDSDKNIAWITGFKLNKAKEPGSWELGYSYRDLQADSATGLNDSDFISGGTAGRGHEIKAKYQLHKNVQAGLTYIMAERDRPPTGTDLSYDRIMADLIFKF